MIIYNNYKNIGRSEALFTSPSTLTLATTKELEIKNSRKFKKLTGDNKAYLKLLGFQLKH